MTPPRDQQLRVGIVGAGDMGRTHLDAWLRLGYNPMVYTRRSSTASQSRAQPTPHTSDLDRLLDVSDVVDLCSPTDTHLDLIGRAAAAGKHLICEKPLALTHDDASAAVAAARDASVELHIAHVVRYFEAYALARDLVCSGAIGQLTGLTLTRTGPAPTSSWFADDARSGGVLTDQMIHDFDYARWVAGEADFVSARTTPGPGHTVTASATVRHRSGITSYLEGGWLGPNSVFTTSLSATGTAGDLHHVSHRPQLALMTAGTDHIERTWPLSGASPYDRQLADFADAIAGGSPPRVTTADAVAAVDLTVAARRAARTGRNEPVDGQR